MITTITIIALVAYAVYSEYRISKLEKEKLKLTVFNYFDKNGNSVSEKLYITTSEGIEFINIKESEAKFGVHYDYFNEDRTQFLNKLHFELIKTNQDNKESEAK